MTVINEYDGYKMPPPLTAPPTPEQIAEREQIKRRIMQSAQKFREKHNLPASDTIVV